MKLLNSILSNMEDTLFEGNVLIDPFYILDISSVEDINIHAIESFIVSIVDKEKLYEATTEFNYNIWKHLTYTNKFINVDKNLNKLILRFIWFLCYKLIYNDKRVFKPVRAKLKFTEIVQNDLAMYDKLHIDYDNLYVHIWNSNDYYTMEFTGITGTLVRIKFKNISKL